MDESTSVAPSYDGGTSTTTATSAPATPRRDERDALPWTIAGHRATVVRRLLDRGLTARTLATVLPEWAATIDDVARAHQRGLLTELHDNQRPTIT